MKSLNSKPENNGALLAWLALILPNFDDKQGREACLYGLWIQ